MVDCYCHQWISCFLFFKHPYYCCRQSNIIIVVFSIVYDGVYYLLRPLSAIYLLLLLLLLLFRRRCSSSFSSSRGCCCSCVTNTLPVVFSFVRQLLLHPVALYLLPLMDWVLLLLLPSTSFPPLPRFELFLCSSLVAATNDDDDDDDYANEYHICYPPLSFCCIPKSIIDESAISIDVSNSPVSTTSKNATSDTIDDVLHLHIPASLMMTHWWCQRKRKSEFKNQ